MLTYISLWDEMYFWFHFRSNILDLFNLAWFGGECCYSILMNSRWNLQRPPQWCLTTSTNWFPLLFGWWLEIIKYLEIIYIITWSFCTVHITCNARFFHLFLKSFAKQVEMQSFQFVLMHIIRFQWQAVTEINSDPDNSVKTLCVRSRTLLNSLWAFKNAISS